MRLTPGHPTLLDILGVCNDLGMDEIQQFQALHGPDIDPEVIAVQLFVSQGPKLCLRDENGSCVVVMGIRTLRQGVGETWFLVRADGWEKHGREITKRAAQLLKDTIASGAWNRLECWAEASRHKAARWYATIGLVHECTLKSYGVFRDDFSVYVAIREAD